MQVLTKSAAEATCSRAALELATIQLESQHPEAALSTLQGALTRFPKGGSVPALEFRTAEALEKQKRFAEAETHFLKVAESFPDDAWADDALLRAARSAFERGDFALAGRLAAKFPAQFGRSDLKNEARLIEARAAASSGRPKDAVAILEQLAGAGASSGAKMGNNTKDSSLKADLSKAGARAAAPRFRRPSLNLRGMSSRWLTGRSDDRMKPMPFSQSFPRGRAGRSRRTLSS